MKTKEFNVTSELEKIAQKMNNDETLFAIYVNDKKKELSALTTGEDDKDIVCTIAAILETSLTGEGDFKSLDSMIQTTTKKIVVIANL